MKIYGFILAFIAIFFFSFSALWARFLTTDEALNPVFLVFLRYIGGILGLLLFLPFVIKKKEIKEIFSKKRNILKNKNFWLSSIFLFLNLVFFIAGTKLSSASNVMLIEALSPIIVGLISLIYFWNKIGKSYKTIFYLLLFSTIGSSLLFSDNSFIWDGIWKSKSVGDAFAFIWMIFFAIFSFFYVELRKDFKDVNGVIITLLFLLVGAILSFPSIFFFYRSFFEMTTNWYLVLALVSFGSTGIAYLTWFLAWKYLSAILLAMLFNLVGIITILYEHITYGQIHNDITYKLILWAIIVLWVASYANYLDTKKLK